ncbi:MAG: hypothetical protein R3B47_00930 [Bacteroidia bacterium]
MILAKKLIYSIAAQRSKQLKIVFVPEGFSSEQNYIQICKDFIVDLQGHYPFNFLINNDLIEIYSLFPDIESTPSGSLNHSILETEINNFQIEVNRDIVSSIIENSYFNDSPGEAIRLSDQIHNGEVEKSLNLCLVIVLLPKMGSEFPYGIAQEFPASSDDYFFIATSVDNLWYQIVLRTICRIIGLGDEFYAGDGIVSSPNEFEGTYIDTFFPNLLYLESNPKTINIQDSKWKKYYSNIQSSLIVNDNAEVNSIYSYMSEDVEAWVGGGSFEKKIFRSYGDCLLSYEINNELRPLRNSRKVLCRLCESYFLKIARNMFLGED